MCRAVGQALKTTIGYANDIVLFIIIGCLVSHYFS